MIYMSSINILYHLLQARRNQWLQTSDLEKLQTKKLRAIVRHAYENVPFYNNKEREFWETNLLKTNKDFKSQEDFSVCVSFNLGKYAKSQRKNNYRLQEKRMVGNENVAKFYKKHL